MTKLQRVVRIARRMRQAFEMIGGLEGGSEDLGGYCGRAAIQLRRACRREGIVIGLHTSDDHAFNSYQDHLIDITATQFSRRLPKVLVRRRAECKAWYHQISSTFRSTAGCYKSLFCSEGEVMKDSAFIRKFSRCR
jgi:hypothetical protein